MQYTAKTHLQENIGLIHYCKKHCGEVLGNKPEACKVLDSIISINTLSIKIKSYYSQK